MPSKIFALMGAAAVSLLAKCRPIRLINLLVPRSGYDVHRGISYGSDPRQKLDLYVPHGLEGTAPMLLFFYGGSWQSGYRREYLAFGEAFASAGIVTVVADYRLYPQVKYPAFVADAASALAWLRAHAGDYGGDAGRIFVSGHSAGAYNAAMLASEPAFLAAHGGTLDWIAGVIGIAGPYNFLPLREAAYIDIFHGANNPQSMPLNHVNGARPPMLLVTGDADDTVAPHNSDDMARVLAAHGSAVSVIRYPGIGHIGVILSLVPGFRGHTRLRQDMLDFIHSR